MFSGRYKCNTNVSTS